jgi:predicted permease
LQAGFSVKQAQEELNAIQAQTVREMSARERGNQSFELTASVQPMQAAVIGDSKTRLWLLMAAVMSLMLIACLNLANAQLGRAISRRREAAVRTALGASRFRLLTSCLIENLILAVTGGVAGIFLASVGLNLFQRYAPVDLPRLAEVHLNASVLLFSMTLTLGCSILFGMAPAIRLMRADPQEALQQGSGRVQGARQSHWLRGWLVGLQIFGCSVLLLFTALLSKNLLQILRQDKGFEPADVAVAEVRLSNSGRNPTLFADGALQTLRQIPGIQSAGLISAMPLEGETWIEGVQRVDKRSAESIVNMRWASPGYFETLRERLVAGRFFEERDGKLNGAVVSESLAKALWPGENPIGGQIAARSDKYTVVGIVADSLNTSLKTNSPRMVYLHYADQKLLFTIAFVARGAQHAGALLPGMRQAIWNYAPDVTISRLKTLDSQVSDSVAAERFQTLAIAAFGISALLLAMLGIYGVLSYATAMRKQEIGVRMALGATRCGVYALALAGAAVPVAIGVVGGLIAYALAGHVLRGLVQGVETVDPWTMLFVFAVLLTAAAIAAFLPARRAASVDAMEALRSD